MPTYLPNFLPGLNSLSASSKAAWESKNYNLIKGVSESEKNQIYLNTKFKEAFGNDPNYNYLCTLDDNSRNNLLMQYNKNVAFKNRFGNESNYGELTQMDDATRNQLLDDTLVDDEITKRYGKTKQFNMISSWDRDTKLQFLNKNDWKTDEQATNIVKANTKNTEAKIKQDQEDFKNEAWYKKLFKGNTNPAVYAESYRKANKEKNDTFIQKNNKLLENYNLLDLKHKENDADTKARIEFTADSIRNEVAKNPKGAANLLSEIDKEFSGGDLETTDSFTGEKRKYYSPGSAYYKAWKNADRSAEEIAGNIAETTAAGTVTAGATALTAGGGIKGTTIASTGGAVVGLASGIIGEVGGNHPSVMGDKDGRNGLSQDELISMYATYKTMKEKYGLGTALSYADKYIKEKMTEKQNWADKQENTMRNIWIGGLTNTMNKYFMIQGAVRGTYNGLKNTDDPLYLQGKDRNKPILDANGKQKVDKDGRPMYEDLPWYNNPKYFSDAEMANSFDPTVINIYNETGGLSKYQNVYEGDQWSVPQVADNAIRMLKFAWSDAVASQLIGAASRGIINKFTDATWIKKLPGGSIQRVSPYTFGAELSPELSSAAAQRSMLASSYLNAAFMSAGISQAYGIQTFEQTRQEGQERANAAMDKIVDERIAKQINTPEAQAEIEAKVNDYIAQRRSVEGAVPVIRSTVEKMFRNAYKDHLRSIYEEEYKNSDEYKKDMDGADIGALAAYHADSALEFGCMFVNNFWGPRRLLMDRGTRSAIANRSSSLHLKFDEAGNLVQEGGKAALWKSALENAWGGFESNYHDDVRVAFGKGFGLNKMDSYTKGHINSGDYINYGMNYWGNLLSGILYAKDHYFDLQNAYDGLVGSLGSFTNVGVNWQNVLSKKNATEIWNDEQLNKIEKLAQYINNPILNDYVEKKNRDRAAEASMNTEKAVWEAYSPMLQQATSFLAGYNNHRQAKEDSALDEQITETKNQQLFDLINMLSDIEENYTLFKQSKQYQQLEGVLSQFDARKQNKNKFWQMLDKLKTDTAKKPEDFTEEERTALVKDYLRETSSLEEVGDYGKMSESEQKATFNEVVNTLRSNVESFYDMRDRIEAARKEFAPLYKRMGADKTAAAQDAFNELIYQKVMMDKHKDMLNKMEEKISGNSSIADHMSYSYRAHLISSYGTKEGYQAATEAAQTRVEELKQQSKELQAKIDKQKTSIEEKSENGTLLPNKKDAVTLSSLQLSKEALDRQLSEAESHLQQVKTHAKDVEDGALNEVLTAEEIIALPPRARRMMLQAVDKDNPIISTLDKQMRTRYSKEQVTEIQKARTMLEEKLGKDNAMNYIYYSDYLNDTVQYNKYALQKIQEYPEEMVMYADAMRTSEFYRADGAIRAYNVHLVEKDINQHLVAQQSTNPRYERATAIKEVLGRHQSQLIEDYVKLHPEDKETLEEVLKKAKLKDDIRKIVYDGKTLGFFNFKESADFVKSIDNIIKDAITYKDVIDKLERALGEDSIESDMKTNINTLLDALTTLEYSRNATIQKEIAKEKKAKEEREAKAKLDAVRAKAAADEIDAKLTKNRTDAKTEIENMESYVGYQEPIFDKDHKEISYSIVYYGVTGNTIMKITVDGQTGELTRRRITEAELKLEHPEAISKLELKEPNPFNLPTSIWENLNPRLKAQLTIMQKNQARYVNRDDTYYYIKNAITGKIEAYQRVHGVIGNNYKLNGEDKGHSPALQHGTTIDELVREFFTFGTLTPKNCTNKDDITTDALESLRKSLEEIKKSIDENGMTFLTNNIILFHDFKNGTKVAGEVDILALTKDGRLAIYDLKTSHFSFYKEDFGNTGFNRFDWGVYDEEGKLIKRITDPKEAAELYKQGCYNKYVNKPLSKADCKALGLPETEAGRLRTKEDVDKLGWAEFNYTKSPMEQYAWQLSAYLNLLESEYDLEVDQLGILPILLGYDTRDEKTPIEEVTKQKGIKIEYDSTVPVPLEKYNEEEHHEDGEVASMNVKLSSKEGEPSVYTFDVYKKEKGTTSSKKVKGGVVLTDTDDFLNNEDKVAVSKDAKELSERPMITEVRNLEGNNSIIVKIGDRIHEVKVRNEFVNRLIQEAKTGISNNSRTFTAYKPAVKSIAMTKAVFKQTILAFGFLPNENGKHRVFSLDMIVASALSSQFSEEEINKLSDMLEDFDKLSTLETENGEEFIKTTEKAIDEINAYCRELEDKYDSSHKTREALPTEIKSGSDEKAEDDFYTKIAEEAKLGITKVSEEEKESPTIITAENEKIDDKKDNKNPIETTEEPKNKVTATTTSEPKTAPTAIGGNPVESESLAKPGSQMLVDLSKEPTAANMMGETVPVGIDKNGQLKLEDRSKSMLTPKGTTVLVTPENGKTVAEAEDEEDAIHSVAASPNLMSGNFMYGYVLKALRELGKIIRRTDKNSDDSAKWLDKLNRWYDDNKLKPQEVIDNELGKIIKANPNTPIYTMTMRTSDLTQPSNRPKYTDYTGLSSIVFMVIEATPEVQEIHNEINGSYLTVNGRQYLVLGTLGTAGIDTQGSNKQLNWKIMVNSTKLRRENYFEKNPNSTERYFVDRTAPTKVYSISNGFMVRQMQDDTADRYRPITELLKGARNPQGLRLKDLVFAYQSSKFTILGDREPGTVRYTPTRQEVLKGSVFVEIPLANGNKTYIQIQPVHYGDGNLVETSEIGKKITANVLALKTTDYNKRYEALLRLFEDFVMGGENPDILIGDETHPTITILERGETYEEFKAKGKKPLVIDENLDTITLVNAIKAARFRIKVDPHLFNESDEIIRYANAGLLNTNIAKLGTSNAMLNIHAVDADGNILPIEGTTTTPMEGDVQGKTAIHAGTRRYLYGNQYVYDKETKQWKDDKGNPIDTNTITGESLIFQLETLDGIDKGTYPFLMKQGQSEYYLMPTNNGTRRFIVKNTASNEITVLSDKQTEAKVDTWENDLRSRSKMSAAKEALKKLGEAEGKDLIAEAIKKNSNLESEVSIPELTQEEYRAQYNNIEKQQVILEEEEKTAETKPNVEEKLSQKEEDAKINNKNNSTEVKQIKLSPDGKMPESVTFASAMLDLDTKLNLTGKSFYASIIDILLSKEGWANEDDIEDMTPREIEQLLINHGLETKHITDLNDLLNRLKDCKH